MRHGTLFRLATARQLPLHAQDTIPLYGMVSRPQGMDRRKAEKGGELLQHWKDFCRRHPVLLAGLLLAAVCALAAAWAGFDLASRVDGQPVYTIVNDTYSRVVSLQGATQTLPVAGGQTLYGVRLDLATYNHAFATGTLHARLCRSDGTVLAEGSVPCIELKDNTFTAVIFDRPYTPASDETLQLVLSADGFSDEEAALPLGLWVSEGVRQPVEESGVTGLMTLRDASGTPCNATAAIQYVVDYSGRWSRVLSLVLGVLVFAAVLLGFVLLARRGAYWAVVLACGAVLGVAFAFLTPPLVGPDEYTHLAASYEMASTLLDEPVTNGEADGWRLLVRPCDAPYFSAQSGDIGIFAYKTYLSGLRVTGCDPTPSVSSDFTVGGRVNALLYLGQTGGIALARVLGLGFHGMLLAGRLGNLLLYLLLAALAVALAPAARRGLMTCVALLPQALQLAASLSADAMVLGLVFSFTALFLSLRRRPARRLEPALLVVLAMAIGPAKAIYLPVVLLVLAIPAAHLDPRGPGAAPLALPLGKRRAAVPAGQLVKALALVLALAGWLWLNLGALLYATRDVDNVGLTRAAVAVAIAAAVLGFVYYKVHRHPLGRRIFFGVLIAGLCVTVPVAFWRLTHMWGGLTPEQLVNSIQANGDSIYTYSAGYICRNLPATIKLLLRSLSAQGASWLQGLLGTALGEPIVYPIQVSWLLGVGLVLALLAAALPQAPASGLPRRTRVGGTVLVLCVVGLTFFAALSWTPINYDTIFGVQGRYWLPVLPLALWLLGGGRTFAVQRPVARKATLAVLCLTSLVILQGAGLYATWQMS